MNLWEVIEDLERNTNVKLRTSSKSIDEDFRSPIFVNFIYIAEDAFDIKMQKTKVKMKRVKNSKCYYTGKTLKRKKR